MDKLIKTTRVVKADTGEVVSDHIQQFESFMYKDGKGYLFINNQSKVYSLVNPGLPEIVGQNDTAYLTRLSRYLDTHNLLRSPKQRRLPMTTIQLADTVGLSKRRVYTFLQRMIEAGVMAKVDGMYYINPLYFTVNRYLPQETYDLFRDQLAPYIPDWAKKRYLLG